MILSVAARFGLLTVVATFLLLGDASANGKRPIPKPLTMEEKVKGSDLVFIGETTRVFFTDFNGKELENDPENPRYSATWLSVRVKKVLSGTGAEANDELTINHPTGGSTGPFLRERYVGKDWIFFIQVERVLRKIDGDIVRVETPMFTKGRWLVYPHQPDQLDELLEAINTLRSEK